MVAEINGQIVMFPTSLLAFIIICRRRISIKLTKLALLREMVSPSPSTVAEPSNMPKVSALLPVIP